MIDHTGVIASDFRRSLAWYQASLAPLRYGLLMQFSAAVTGSADVAGFGEATSGKPDFWVSAATPEAPAHRPPVHVAFRAASRVIVDAFYKAALAAGGADNGAPGVRPHYHANYYGAFVRDPDGNNIEAVCHDPP
jgi:catechol 2,3-dioxygenase-like lactoylglutathione lyase family enzyme